MGVVGKILRTLVMCVMIGVILVTLLGAINAANPSDATVVEASGRDAAAASNPGTQTATVSATSWPMFRGGPDHSGYNPYETTLKPPLELNWSYTTGEEVWSSPAVVDGVVYFGSFDRNMYAVRADTGALKWSYRTDGAIHSSPAVDNGVVFFGSEDGKIYALEAETGALIWSFSTGKAIVSSPTVVNGVVYVGSSSGKLYALQAASGEVVWSFDTGASNFPSLAVVGDTVFFADEAKLYALEAGTGGLVWTTELSGGSFDSSPAVVAGILYIWNGPKLCAFNATTGDIIWSYATGAGSPSSPAISQGTVYFASFDHKVYAVDAATGNLKWTYSTGGIIVSSPSVANGIVYVGSNDGKFYALRVGTGEVVWTHDIGQSIQSSPAIADGAVYVGSMTRKLYAFTLTPTPPAASPTIAFSPSSLSFSATEGGSNPGSQTLGIWNSGGGTLNWSVSGDAPWLTLSPTGGSSTGETDDVTVSVDISGMAAESYSATIAISDPEANNSPQTVLVSLTISPPQETVSAPTTPDGPTSRQVGQALTYTTGGSSSNLGHSLEYRFDWGDGTMSGWTPSGSLSHSWSNPGSYTMKAQARCAIHTGVLSAWSSGLTVNVTLPPTVSAEIVSYSAAPREVEVGNPVKLSFSFINTGNTPWTFYAAVSLRKPNGEEVHLLPLEPVFLNPGEQGSATWTYTIDMEGNWDVVFGVWEEQEQINSLGHTGWLSDYIVGIPLPSATQYTLTIPFNPLGTITLSPKEDSFQIVLSPDTGAVEETIFYYKAGTEVTLTAEPASGNYVFSHWGGDVGGIQNPGTITINSNICVTAYFISKRDAGVLEKAGLEDQEIAQLKKIVEEVLENAKLTTNQERKRSLLNQAEIILSGIKRDAKVRDLIREKTESERLVLDMLAQAFAQGLKYWAKVFYNIDVPTPIGMAIARGAEELGNQIVEWLWLGQLGYLQAKVPGIGSIEIAGERSVVVTPKLLDKLWVGINSYNPPGQIFIYIPLEPVMLSPPGSGNVLLTTGDLRPIMDNVKIAYRYDAIVVEAGSPVELRVYDSQGRVTGAVSGEIKEEIPNSGYHEDVVTILFPSDSYFYEVAGTSEGSYDLAVTTIAEETNTFSLTKVPTSTKTMHQYTIDWGALSEGEKGVTMKIDSDGDGTFEDIKKLGSKGAGPSWVWIAVAGLSGLVGVLVGAFMVRRRMSRKQAA